MITEETLWRLVDLAYDAAAEPSHWSSLIKELTTVTGSSQSAIIIADFEKLQDQIVSSYGISPESMSIYEQHYYKVNPWTQRAIAIDRPGIPLTSSRIFPENELRKTEFYADYLRRANFFHLCGVTLVNEKTWKATLTIARPENREPYTNIELQFLSRLGPHLLRAATIHRKMLNCELVRDASLAVLDKVSDGVILLSETGKVILINTTAEALLKGKDGIYLDNAELHASCFQEDRILQRFVKKAIQAARGWGLFLGGNLCLSRPASRSALSVIITPLSKRYYFFGQQKGVIAILVTDPAKTLDRSETIRQSYGLTKAETKEAILLSQGKSLKEVADELGISYNTARNHLKQIFQKTYTNRQGQLVRKLLTNR